MWQGVVCAHMPCFHWPGHKYTLPEETACQGVTIQISDTGDIKPVGHD